MMQAFTVVGGVLGALLLVILCGCVLFTIHCIWMYRCHKCKHCGHFMNFKGLKPDNEEGHFLFHCPKCGAWEQIPKEKFYRDNEGIDKEYD